MKAVVLAAATCLLSPRVALAQSFTDSCRANDATRAVCETEARLTAALRRNDANRLEQIYAQDFTLINYRGRRVDRAAVLAAIRSGALHFDSLTTSDLHLQVEGNVALLTGQQHQVAREPGTGETAHPQRVRFTHVYIQRGGKWLLLASQITPIAR